MDELSTNLFYILPEIIIVLTAVVIIFIDLMFKDKRYLPQVSALGILGAIFLACYLWVSGNTGYSFGGMLITDKFSIFLKLLVLISTLIVILGTMDYVGRLKRFQGEYYTLILFAAFGMMLLTSAVELITIFVVLEIQTFSFIALTALEKKNRSFEAAIKYLLLSAIATCVMLYGMAMFFGFTGTTFLIDMSTVLSGNILDPSNGSNLVIITASIFILSGFIFKIAGFPFHSWVPDVYEGAPTPVTGYLSVASKAVGVGILMRVFYVTFENSLGLNWIEWPTILSGLSVLSMFFGNLVAIKQTKLKRMLAYSSIAHAGYIFLALTYLSDNEMNLFSGTSVLFYLTGYAFTNLLAFMVITIVSNSDQNENINSLDGLYKRSPFLAGCMALSLISLTGLPPTGLFFGKIYIFYGAVESGYWWLALLGVLNSFISAYYYLRPIRFIYSDGKAASNILEKRTHVYSKIALMISVLGILILGLLPFWLFGFAESAVISLI